MGLRGRSFDRPTVVMRPLAGYAEASGAANSDARIVRPDKRQWILTYGARDNDIRNGTRFIASVRIIRATCADVPVENPRHASWVVAAHLSVQAMDAQRQDSAENYNAITSSIGR